MREEEEHRVGDERKRGLVAGDEKRDALERLAEIVERIVGGP